MARFVNDEPKRPRKSSGTELKTKKKGGKG